MADLTARMVALLGAMRRERNGAVADAMRYYGANYGLNYGVSLPTVRSLARAVGRDHEFARFLYRQQVRELRLAALHIAEPERLTADEYAFWGDGLCNSELAEEAAFALLGRIAAFDGLFHLWCGEGIPLQGYAAVMAAARRDDSPRYVEPAAAWLRRIVSEGDHAASHLAGRGVATLFVACGARNEENRQTVLRLTGSLGTSPAEDCVHEEVAAMLGE